MPQACISPLYTERTRLPQGCVVSPLLERQVMPQGCITSPPYMERTRLPQGSIISPLYTECVLGVPQGTVIRPLSTEGRNLPYKICAPQGSMISPPCLEEVPRRTIISPRSNKMTGIPQGWSVSSFLTERKHTPQNMGEPQEGTLSPFRIGGIPQGGVMSPLHLKGVPQGTIIRPISTNRRNEQDLGAYQGSTFRPHYTEERTVPHVMISPQLIGVPQQDMLRPLCTKSVPQRAIISSHLTGRGEVPHGPIRSLLYTEKKVALGKEGVLESCTIKPLHVERKEMQQGAGISERPIVCIPDTEGREVPQGCILGPLNQTLGLPQEGTFSPLYTERRDVSQGKIISHLHYQKTEIPQEIVLNSLIMERILEVPQGTVSHEESKLQCDKTDIYQENLFSPRVVVSRQENKKRIEIVKIESPFLNISSQPSYENVMGLHQDSERSPPLITSSERFALGFSAELLQEKMPYLFIASPQSPTSCREFKEKASTNLPSTSTASMRCTTLVSSDLDVISPTSQRPKSYEAAPMQNEANEENQQKNVNDTQIK